MCVYGVRTKNRVRAGARSDFTWAWDVIGIALGIELVLGSVWVCVCGGVALL